MCASDGILSNQVLISSGKFLKDKKSLKISNGVIIIRQSKKDRQHNDQKKKVKKTNNDIQHIHRKLKIELHEPHLIRGWDSCAPEGSSCFYLL